MQEEPHVRFKVSCTPTASLTPLRSKATLLEIRDLHVRTWGDGKKYPLKAIIAALEDLVGLQLGSIFKYCACFTSTFDWLIVRCAPKQPSETAKRKFPVAYFHKSFTLADIQQLLASRDDASSDLLYSTT